MNKLLYPFSFIYNALSAADRKLKKPAKFDKPVISVGNLTWGGTGKTPIVIELLKFLSEKNLHPAVLTRGYGRKQKTPMFLQNGAENISPLQSGDEPLLIAKSVPCASVIIGADRYKNALKYEAEIMPDVYVLDDGFQHWKIERDLDIVCVNAADPFGNGMLIPAGSLREKPSALKRAGLTVITNSDMIPEDKLKSLEEKISDLSGKRPVVTYYGDYEYKTTDLKKSFDISVLKKSEVYAVSGIGFAKGFLSSIEKTGIKIAGTVELKDHKNYSSGDIKKIFDKTGSDSYAIVTAKDSVKINEVTDENIKNRIAVLTVLPQFKTGKEEWEKTILKSLRLL